MPGPIPAADRVSYAEASEITGRSHRYLRQQAQRGALTREGGTRRDVYTTWLSRTELEALALASHTHGHVPPPYWLTLTAAAELLGIRRQGAHQALVAGRIPAQRAGNGEWLIRRSDALLLADAFPGRQSQKTPDS